MTEWYLMRCNDSLCLYFHSVLTLHTYHITLTTASQRILDCRHYYACLHYMLPFHRSYLLTFTTLLSAPYLPSFLGCSLAKKSFTGYLRSLQLLPGKSQQDISKLPLDAFAISLGLGMTPEAPVAPQGEEERGEVREKKNVNR